MRGYRTLFSEFTDGVSPVKPVARKGRSEQLVAQRNELLTHRYYYFTKVARMQYGDAINILKQQFFLEERTIVFAIQQNSALLYKLHHEKPAVKYLSDKYPFLKWN